MATQPYNPRQPAKSRLKFATILIGAFAVIAVALWTFDRQVTRLYCSRCAALREMIGYEVLGMSMRESDSTRMTGLSRWIESNTGETCNHQWAPGYTDGFWSRTCHLGNRADYYRTWGDDSALLAALTRRQLEDSSFVRRVVDSVEHPNAESYNFLIAVQMDDLVAQSWKSHSQPTSP